MNEYKLCEFCTISPTIVWWPAVAIRVSVDYHRSDIAGAENYFTRVLSNADRHSSTSPVE